MTGVATFEAERARLTGVAYRMLGSLVDAEDVVQEAWLRWDRTDQSRVDQPAAWLTTVTSRLAIDRLRARMRQREEYVGPWLPEPVLTTTGRIDHVAPRPDDPAERITLDESLTMGFLVLLERLGALERAVFLLADVFDEPYAWIGEVVDRSPEACRQMASRARRKIRDGRLDRAAVDEGLLAELVGAIAAGDMEGVIGLLSPEVVLHSDGGPHRRAARLPVLGPERVARLLVNLAKKAPEGADIAFREVNAAPALVVRSPELTMAVTAERDGSTGAVVAVRVLLNPDKVGGLDAPVAMA